MSKHKKKFGKRINPEKSNKMIYAVVAGLLLLVGIVLAFVIMGDSSVDKADLMDKTLSYLKKDAGIITLDCKPAENTVRIVYDSGNATTKNRDFKQIAKYAGVKLSNRLGKDILTVVLFKDNDTQKEYTVMISDGEVVGEEQ